MSNIFDDRPMDDDTEIISSKIVKIGDRDVCMEHWRWDGIKVKSAILLASQFDGFSDEGIVETLISHMPLGGDYTIVRRPEYIVVNYGFRT